MIKFAGDMTLDDYNALVGTKKFTEIAEFLKKNNLTDSFVTSFFATADKENVDGSPEQSAMFFDVCDELASAGLLTKDQVQHIKSGSTDQDMSCPGCDDEEFCPQLSSGVDEIYSLVTEEEYAKADRILATHEPGSKDMRIAIPGNNIESITSKLVDGRTLYIDCENDCPITGRKVSHKVILPRHHVTPDQLDLDVTDGVLTIEFVPVIEIVI